MSDQAVVDCLVAARKRIENSANWGKGNEVFAEDPKNNKDCAQWAIYRVRGIDHGTYVDGAIRLLKRGAGVTHLVEWNDAPERTHAEVLAAFDKAIELARQA